MSILQRCLPMIPIEYICFPYSYWVHLLHYFQCRLHPSTNGPHWLIEFGAYTFGDLFVRCLVYLQHQTPSILYFLSFPFSHNVSLVEQLYCIHLIRKQLYCIHSCSYTRHWVLGLYFVNFRNWVLLKIYYGVELVNILFLHYLLVFGSVGWWLDLPIGGRV